MPGEAYDYMEDLLLENLDTITTGDSIGQTIRRDAEKWFTNIKQKSDTSEIQVRTGIVVSTKGIGETIADYARREGVGLIVMGTKGVGFRERMHGSTSYYVIEHAMCPVLLVR
jgi:nucleotide-binding universal stress UspA family protein